MARIVIAAGGTAGHVVPALAVADELRADGADVSFVGSERAEAALVPAAGYPILSLGPALAGLERRRPVRAARALLAATAATRHAVALLGRLRPDAVLAAGGYVGAPVGIAATLRRIPLVLMEADSRLGVANRALAPLARRVCLAFPIAGRRGERYLVTGRPVHSSFGKIDRDAARKRFGVPAGARCLLVFGGSLGARSINRCALAAFAGWPAGGEDAVVLHVAGRRDRAELAAELERLGSPAHYRLYEWIETLAEPLAACDLVVARSGGSVFELAAAGRPAVLVPYPHATGQHQLANARWLADAGAAVVLPDAELGPERLAGVVSDLLSDRRRLETMGRAARRIARPDAAARVAAELLAAAGEGSPRRAPPPAAGERPERTVQANAARPWSGRRLHFTGIGGAGMSGLALVARELGAEVSGCDRAESSYTDLLRGEGIEPFIGHSPDHALPGVELVVSTAVPADEPELAAARSRGLAMQRRGALLAEIASLRRLLAIAGTHGKTTTAAMAAHCLIASGLEPSYVIGASVDVGRGGARNAALGAGEWLVAETDESDRSFLELDPEVAVVTNVELDHHTTYGSILELERAFASFLARVPASGTAVVPAGGAPPRLVPDDRRTITFGLAGEVTDGPRVAPDVCAAQVRPEGSGTAFELLRGGEAVCEVTLGVPGTHNVLNALAALVACELAGADLATAARALAGFRAAARRFELKADAGGVRVIDDYAHHPTEVSATLEAARALEPKRLIAIFQPHLYSRTFHLHHDLGRALAAADVAVVLDVYPARERPAGDLAGVTGKLVAEACADHAGGRPVWWLPTLEEAEAVIGPKLSEGDVVLTLGAGDVDRLAERLAAGLGERVVLAGESPG